MVKILHIHVRYSIVYLTAFFLVASGYLTHAQETRVTGKVFDALTNEPIPFCNVFFKGTATGTVTDINGNYSVTAKEKVDSLTASFIGYLPVTMRVQMNKVQVFNFSLKVNKVELNEINVKAGENPANILLRKIIENKDRNDKEQFDYYSYETYNKLEFDLTNITEEFKNKKLLKPFKFIFENIDSTETNRKPFLPFFITESLSDYYFRKSPKARKEIIHASKVSGIDNPTVTQFLGDMYQNINIYDNYILIFGKSFVSPISNAGLLFYKYYLTDSAFISDKWCYKLKFKPRAKQSLTFSGECWVNDTTFAIRKIDMRVVPDANLNWINDLAIVKEFDKVQGDFWMLIRDILVIDFAVKEEGMGFIGRKSTSYKSFRINEIIPDTMFADENNDIIVNEQAIQKPDSFWAQARHDSLALREQKIYAMVDTIKSLPAFKTYVDIITLFFTGYKKFGKFEYGPYYTTYSFNAIEGNRFRLGGRTSDNFSTKYEIGGYVAYGLKDEQFKYSGLFRWFISQTPRKIFGIGYKKDVQQFGQSENAFQDDNILSSLFRRSAANKLTQIEERKMFLEHEWFAGFSNTVTVTHTDYAPLGDLTYTYYTDDSLTRVKNTISTSEINLYTRFLYREKFVNGKSGRVSLGSRYPLMQFNYTLGVKGLVNSDFTYHRISGRVSDDIKLPPFGYTYYFIESGKIFGTVPYPLLEVHKGNESYFYDYLSFNLMNYYEFVSDRYVSFYAAHHFDGFFLDKIPLFKKLKWREVATIKGVYGLLSAGNKKILFNPGAFSTLKQKPYLEAGVGVENILKILRFDFLWRLSYINKEYLGFYKQQFPESKPPVEFGIRGSFQITF